MVVPAEFLNTIVLLPAPEAVTHTDFNTVGAEQLKIIYLPCVLEFAPAPIAFVKGPT